MMLVLILFGVLGSSQVLNAQEELCDAVYEERCYIGVIDDRHVREGSIKVCEDLGGAMANLYSKEHQEMVDKAIADKKLGASARLDFRLGMTYDPKFNALHYRDGKQAPLSSLHWAYLWPRFYHPGWTDVILTVTRGFGAKSRKSEEWLTNKPPTNEYYVLCEFDL